MLSVPFDSPYPSTEVSLFERCGHAPSVPQQESLVIAVGGKCICMWGDMCMHVRGMCMHAGGL